MQDPIETTEIARRDFLRIGAVAAVALPAMSLPQAQILLARQQENNMDLKRVGSTPSQNGPAEWFTGSVRIDSLFQAKDPSRVSGASVTFEPGARTAWHTHPLGQHLIITSGLGWVQQEGGPIQEVRPGDVVWFPPGVKHWHGASPTHAMMHTAIQEAQKGSPVDWLEHVSDEQYRKRAEGVRPRSARNQQSRTSHEEYGTTRAEIPSGTPQPQRRHRTPSTLTCGAGSDRCRRQAGRVEHWRHVDSCSHEAQASRPEDTPA